MRKSLLLITGLVLTIACLSRCSNNKADVPATTVATTEAEKPNFGGFDTQVKWGEHLVTIGGCNDCHTPKKMTPAGPADDSTLMLSGHPETLPAPEVDRKAMESKGLVVTSDFTAWIGPWGITYSANLTPDPSGLGNWTEEQFLYALRNSISKGMAGGRPLMPPMSMMPVKHMSDDELKAIFAYLKTIKPVKNVSVQPTPPALARK
ncbi:c-type cytochrome [Flavihumibacter petaseus]|uniref:Putative cytochrome c n=1 Tax=Flavihumibacter petaseus NBRC 106054 TaxID=1220578 RepID=A0A0E9N0L8_9BACT|nr:c-type cytochrome [Flavihumibacter petaseus]GAO43333.1 putative cytochrome c [Flavihumibacter petaseus NBRC 106054]